jgi:hypothetical protein
LLVEYYAVGVVALTATLILMGTLMLIGMSIALLGYFIRLVRRLFH